MKARGLSVQQGFDGKVTLTVEIVDAEGRAEAKRLFDELHECDLDLSVKKFREKRSLNANAYAWKLIGDLAEYMNLPSEEVYRNYIKSIGVYRDIEITESAENTMKTVWQAYGLGWLAERVDFAEREGFITLRLYYGSSVYTKKQMSRFISAIKQDCDAVGIVTMTPAEIERMVSLWGQQTRD